VSAAKHTPGPWVVSADTECVADAATGKIVARCMTANRRQSGEMAPNAALIAAAPELADALGAIAALTLGGNAGLYSDDVARNEAHRIALNALAKAGLL
jgi:hypothetical protein